MASHPDPRPSQPDPRPPAPRALSPFAWGALLVLLGILVVTAAVGGFARGEGKLALLFVALFSAGVGARAWAARRRLR